MKKANNFQIEKVKLLSFCFIFCQFQPGVVYKILANRRERVYEIISNQVHFHVARNP